MKSFICISEELPDGSDDLCQILRQHLEKQPLALKSFVCLLRVSQTWEGERTATFLRPRSARVGGAKAVQRLRTR